MSIYVHWVRLQLAEVDLLMGAVQQQQQMQEQQQQVIYSTLDDDEVEQLYAYKEVNVAFETLDICCE